MDAKTGVLLLLLLVFPSSLASDGFRTLDNVLLIYFVFFCNCGSKTATIEGRQRERIGT